jgi:hypothetical protein
LEERLAVVLTAGPEPAASEAMQPSAGSDEEAVPWPDGATAVEIDRAAAGEPPVTEAALLRPAGPDGPLPALDGLVARIPDPVREALDDLFRVKFINVQRMPPSALKAPPPVSR